MQVIYSLKEIWEFLIQKYFREKKMVFVIKEYLKFYWIGGRYCEVGDGVEESRMQLKNFIE